MASKKKTPNLSLFEEESGLMTYKVTKYATRLVREEQVQLEIDAVKGPSSVVQIAKGLIGEYLQEHCIVLFLNTKLKVMGYQIVGIGSGNQVVLRMDDIFRPVLLSGCTGFVLAHNHPSGECSPSPEDVHITEAAIKAARLLDVDMLDHVIVSNFSDRGYSFKKSFGSLWNRF